MAISISQITKQIGISKTAIYHYLRDPKTNHVSEATKRRIDKAIGKLEFSLNVNAQSLSTSRSRVVVILVPLDTPYFHNTMLGELLSGIQSELFKRNYKFIFVPTKAEKSPDIVREQLKLSSGYDGFILFGTRSCTIHDMRENVEQLLATRIPFVVVNMPELDYEINQVINVTPSSINPIDVLMSFGHKRILLMAGSRRAPDTLAVINKYKQSYAKLGHQVDERLICYGDYERTVARSEMHAILSAGTGFSAVFCLTDTMTLGVYEALEERGLSIPGDISIISRDDAFFATFLNPPLTTLRIPMFETGRSCAELLLRGIETEDPPRKIRLEDELIMRKSVAVCRQAQS